MDTGAGRHPSAEKGEWDDNNQGDGNGSGTGGMVDEKPQKCFKKVHTMVFLRTEKSRSHIRPSSKTIKDFGI